MNVFWNTDYCASNIEFDTARKADAIAAALADDDNVLVCDPASWRFLASEAIAAVHTPYYVRAVRTGEPRALAESNGFSWDNKVFEMARAHTAGMLAAVDQALTTGSSAGTLSSGLHHARTDSGHGYCTFNGIGAACAYAVRRGLKVGVLDFDAHCGGGTYDIIGDMPDVHQFDVSLSDFDSYRTTDVLDIVEDPEDYLDACSIVADVVAGLGFDVVIYNAGMDPVDFGVTFGELARRERMVAETFAAAGVPVAWALAGGYQNGLRSMDDLVALHRLTIDAFSAVV